jgi:DNA mismatch endonuclease, patch repair protein
MVTSQNINPNRSFIMAKVKHTDTQQEVMLRSLLHKRGLRFRKNVNYLPGRPDIVLRKYDVVIFVNGCFWHGHDNCKKGRRPKTKKEYWIPKIEENKKRDLEKIDELLLKKWRVAVVWQCSLNNRKKIEDMMVKLTDWIVTMNTKVSFIEL